MRSPPGDGWTAAVARGLASAAVSRAVARKRRAASAGRARRRRGRRRRDDGDARHRRARSRSKSPPRACWRADGERRLPGRRDRRSRRLRAPAALVGRGSAVRVGPAKTAGAAGGPADARARGPDGRRDRVPPRGPHLARSIATPRAPSPGFAGTASPSPRRCSSRRGPEAALGSDRAQRARFVEGVAGDRGRGPTRPGASRRGPRRSGWRARSSGAPTTRSGRSRARSRCARRPEKDRGRARAAARPGGRRDPRGTSPAGRGTSSNCGRRARTRRRAGRPAPRLRRRALRSTGGRRRGARSGAPPSHVRVLELLVARELVDERVQGGHVRGECSRESRPAPAAPL